MLQFISPNTQKGDTGQQTADMGNGFLIVEVLGQDKHPISLATVMIYSEDKDTIVTHKVLVTGINGKTESVCITGKNIAIPPCGDPHIASFSSFIIRVDYPGYYTSVYKNVRVSADKTTVHTSILIPLPFGVKNAPGLEKVYDLSASNF